MNFADLYWTYKGLIETMERMPGMYGFDQKRTELHHQLEKYYPGQEAELREVLHNLDAGMMPADLDWAVNNIEKYRAEAKREGRYYAR